MNGIGLYGNDFPTIKSDVELVKENITRILTTLPGEDLGNLEFGCRLREYLFNFQNVLLEDIEGVIENAITTWEPRVTIFDISVKLDEELQEKIHVVVDSALTETFEKFNLEIPILF